MSACKGSILVIQRFEPINRKGVINGLESRRYKKLKTVTLWVESSDLELPRKGG